MRCSCHDAAWCVNSGSGYGKIIFGSGTKLLVESSEYSAPIFNDNRAVNSICCEVFSSVTTGGGLAKLIFGNGTKLIIEKSKLFTPLFVFLFSS